MLLSSLHETDEVLIVQAAVSGDPIAFATLFQRHYRVIHAYAYRLCLCQADAQDVAQETFIKAAQGLRDYRPGAPFRHWLYQICTNTARDWLRRRGRRRRMEEAVTSRAEIDALERRPEFDAAREALAALPDGLRAAITLVYFEDMNHAEAARILDCAETTVSWRIFTAKRKLKTYLRSYE